MYMNFFVTYVLDSYTLQRKLFTAAPAILAEFQNPPFGLKQPKIFHPRMSLLA